MEWKSIVRTVAPTLATALGGPLAGIAVKALGDAVLGDATATEDAIAKAVIAMSPADLVKLKEADRAFALQMRTLDIELDKLDAADRAGARSMFVALVPTERGLVFLLAYLIIATFGYSLYWVLSPATVLPADAAKLTLIGTVIGYASAKADQVVGYFFGSSRSSQAKTDALNRAVENLTKEK